MRLGGLTFALLLVGCGSDSFITSDGGGADSAAVDGTSGEGGADDGGDAEAPKPFCMSAMTSKTIFCEDWDGTTAPPGIPTPWMTVTSGGSAAIGTTTVMAISPPNILYGKSSSLATAFVFRAAPFSLASTTGTGITVKFDVRFEAPSSPGALDFLSVTQDTGASTFKATVSLSNGSVELTTGILPPSMLTGTPNASGHYTATLTLSQMATTWQANLSIPTLSSGAVALATGLPPTTFRLSLGVLATQGVAPSVRIDNILVTSN